MDRLRLSPRHALLLVFAAATLVLMGVGAMASIALLRTSLYHAAEQEARREARVLSDTALAGALSHGPLNQRDLKLAAAQYNAARRDLPLTGGVIWLPPGLAIFTRGTGRFDASQGEPRIVREALATGRTEVADLTDPGRGGTLEAAVPLGRRALNAVVDFHFSRSGLQRTVGAAEHRVYGLTAVGGLIMYLLILPLLARLARRVPLPVDPFRRRAVAELKAALARRELVLHYQPKTETRSGRVVGVEALVRWSHPQRGLLGPAEFLPVAESHPELMTALTCQVLDRALSDCAAWAQEGRELPVAVNVAPAVLLGGSLVELVRGGLERHGLGAPMLTVELTESGLMEPEEDVTDHLRELRDLGVSISIDDFGTGNSSLSRLRSLPFDELKVDRSFIARISTDERDLGITRHIVHLGLDLGLRVVAEGVEDERTLRLLRSIGCEVAQGFHLARPMPEDELQRWLRRAGTDPATAESAQGPRLGAV